MSVPSAIALQEFHSCVELTVGCDFLEAVVEQVTIQLSQLCAGSGIELVVIGPEAPLAAGLADALRAQGLTVFGPGREGALLEASKGWAKQLMREAGVPTAGYWQAGDEGSALAALEAHGQPLVVKADGLAAGKGVTVAESVEEARAAIEEIFAGRFGGEASLVLEERTEGPEVSVFALSDGERMVLLPPAQDHKRIGEGDTGPNTGDSPSLMRVVPKGYPHIHRFIHNPSQPECLSEPAGPLFAAHPVGPREGSNDEVRPGWQLGN